jgi:hypothetical protein
MSESNSRFATTTAIEHDGASGLEAVGTVGGQATRLRLLVQGGRLIAQYVAASHSEELFGEGPKRFFESLQWYAE